MRPFLVFSLTLLLAPVLWAQSAELVAKSQRGKQLMGEGKFAEAAVVYEELTKAIPNNAGLLLNLGMALHMSDQHSKAIPALETALKLQPGILPAMMFLGSSYLATGEPAKAIPPLREVVAARADMAQPRQMLGDALVATGRPDSAIEHYRRWTVLERTSPHAWFTLGATYETVAQRAFEALERSAPESPHMLALVGEVRLSQHQYSSAFYLYRETLKRAPGFRGAHAAIAEIYRRTEHADWADAAEAKERDQPKPDCAAHAAECAYLERRFFAAFSSAGRGENAESLYWRARSANALAQQSFDQLTKLPPSLELHRILAQVHRNQERHIEAIEQWQAALKLAPNDPNLLRELAVSYHQSRNDKAALPVFRKLVAQDPNSADLNFMLGDTLLALQQVEEAVTYLRKSVKVDPEMMAGRSALGRALVQIREGAEAIPHLEAALATDGDGTIHFQLARAYQMSGRMEEAKKTMAQSQQMRSSDAAERARLEEEMKITAP